MAVVALQTLHVHVPERVFQSFGSVHGVTRVLISIKATCSLSHHKFLGVHVLLKFIFTYLQS